ncbi:conserved hypothetical protein [uncultured Pleomorphomonas sp.]|uniref:Uncharacterized protein n=1 Tax=uncultured Pleomorphomonas sp. TaxID=442121 RepID=A0A212L223_9HYPH|nr:hypothetical protein [uncultured Pleomorphomonas sp.]SCM71580.1 conserved hypothetical protein [uncultured Pleomorphomonas sp.]
MSHFSVLVVTDQEPTDDVLSMALQPFHEFECTGEDDKYVQDIDITEKRRVEYAGSTIRRFKAPDGGLHDPYDDQFYREWTDEELTRANHGGEAPMGTGTAGGMSYQSKDWGDGRGYRSKVHFVPDGWEEVKFPASEVMSFRDWLESWHDAKVVRPGEQPDLRKEHKYGYAVVDEAGAVVKIIDRTNPNAKWDWWVVGGRYGGRLAPGYDPEKDERNYKTCTLCRGTGRRDDPIGQARRLEDPTYTCNGCSGTGRELKFPTDWVEVGNQARVGDLDLAALKATRVAEMREMVEKIRVQAGAADFGELDSMRRAYKAAIAAWLALPEPRPRGNEFDEWLKIQEHGFAAADYHRADFWDEVQPADGQTIDDWIEATPALSAFAVLKDGEWFEKGEMGWFACVSNEKPDWAEQFDKLFAGLRSDQWITFVDCHI